MEPLSTPIIIGGTTKSGTTSLFQYLGAHPQVCAASMKETRFFLDLDYPLSSRYRYDAGLPRYAEYFGHSQPHQYPLEATPDYLYAHGTAARLHTLLPNARLIFILREPIARFISWYRFSKQIGQLPATATLDEYLAMQTHDHHTATEQFRMALVQGQYAHYLKNYYNHFPHHQIHLCFFEDLTNTPHQVLRTLCQYLQLDPQVYDDYVFAQHNATIGIKHQKLHARYQRASFALRKRVHHIRWLHGTLKGLKQWLHPLYAALNSQPAETPEMTPQAAALLETFYAEEKKLYASRYENLIAHTAPATYPG